MGKWLVFFLFYGDYFCKYFVKEYTFILFFSFILIIIKYTHIKIYTSESTTPQIFFYKDASSWSKKNIKY